MILAEMFRESSRRSWLVAGGSTALVVGALAFSFVPAVAGSAFWGNVPFALLSGAFAILTLVLALQLPRGARVRQQSILLASGIFAYAVGDVAWLTYELGLHMTAPYPGLPDLFYGPAFYAPLSIAVWSAAIGMRRLEHGRRPVVVGTVAAIAAFGVVAATTLAGVVRAPGTHWFERLVSIAYPVADVFALFMPAVVLVMVLTQLGGTPLSRPWWTIALSMLVLAFADGTYGYLQARGLYTSGMWIDVAWLFAFALIAMGVTRLIDVHRVDE